MPANTAPIFTLTPTLDAGAISTANTARDGSGTISTIATGTANGKRISRITIQAISNTIAGQVRLFIGDDAGTPNVRLWKEIAVTAATVSATVQAFTYTLNLFGEQALILPLNYTLRAATHNAEAFNIHVEGGDY